MALSMAGTRGFIMMLILATSTLEAEGQSPRNGTVCRYIVCPIGIIPVCGSDGKTYDNQCLLEKQICINQESGYPPILLERAYDGVCSQTTTPCKQACPDVVPVPVCGTDGATYASQCHLDNERRCRDPFLFKYHGGPCLTPPPPCDIPCEYRDVPVCGSDGKTYPNHCQLDNERRCRNPYLTKQHDGGCRNCDWQCPDDYKPVCGDNQVTYDNFCLWERENCQRNIGLRKANGPCSSAIRSATSTLVAVTAVVGTILFISH